MSNKQSCILLVDDELMNLILLEELLQSQGYVTITATEGNQALEMADRHQPDLILLDVMMPEMNGFEVCQKLRSNVKLQTIPIIFITALNDDKTRIRGLEMMGDDYFTKPIKSDLLLSKISSILRLNKMRNQAAKKANYNNIEKQTNRQLEAAWKINESLSEKFRLFVPEKFLERIAPQGVESIQLGNATEEKITILFADIRGFTTIAESQTATATFTWLNDFFSRMNEAIVSHHGFIDKFLGDAIMAVFDRPEFHPQDALNAAIMMQTKLQNFNNQRQIYNLSTPIQIGIGIHTGIGVIGTLGSNNRMDSTVIGDVVNTASRLENLTKFYRCYLIVSNEVIKQIKPPELFIYRWIDRVILRGKQQTIDLYEFLGTKDNILDAMKVQTQEIFTLAIQAWELKDFATALNYFQKIIDINPQDGVAQFYLELCQERLTSAELII